MRNRAEIAVCSSDWHLTVKRPVSRKTGYVNQAFNKVAWILSKCRELEADLYFAGDIFDRCREPRWLASKYQALFAKMRVTIYGCAGQHDQIFHSKNLTDTSIQTFYAAQMLQRHTPDSSELQAVDWGGEIPQDVDTLIMHYCVTQSPIPYIDYSVTARKFMKQTNARIIVTGDYHEAHHLEYGGRLLINPGSIMRNASDTTQKKPVVYVINTRTAQILDILEVPVLPANEVFDLAAISAGKAAKERKEDLKRKFDLYVANAATKKIRPDFLKNLANVITELNLEESVRLEIDSIKEAVRNECKHSPGN